LLGTEMSWPKRPRPKSPARGWHCP